MSRGYFFLYDGNLQLADVNAVNCWLRSGVSSSVWCLLKVMSDWPFKESI